MNKNEVQPHPSGEADDGSMETLSSGFSTWPSVTSIWGWWQAVDRPVGTILLCEWLAFHNRGCPDKREAETIMQSYVPLKWGSHCLEKAHDEMKTPFPQSLPPLGVIWRPWLTKRIHLFWPEGKEARVHGSYLAGCFDDHGHRISLLLLGTRGGLLQWYGCEDVSCIGAAYCDFKYCNIWSAGRGTTWSNIPAAEGVSSPRILLTLASSIIGKGGDLDDLIAFACFSLYIQRW